ncbi:general transcription factor II-I repeat domain-containing protein 2A [Trichonephila clavipes]|nr:general transcription factor II-I repeat domain-containing protein 2A [Trichonephila clavipes]
MHQEELWAQTFPKEIVEVMNLVIKIVNNILSKLLYHRQFKEFLSEMKTQYSNLLHNKVRWLCKCDFSDRYEQFKSNETTLAFIVNLLNTNSNEIHIEPFGTDAVSLEMQLIDLKSRALWSGKLIELKSKLDVQISKYVTQQKLTVLKEMPPVEALKFDAWNCLPDCYSEMKKLTFGVLNIFGSTYSCQQAFSYVNIIKSKVSSQLTNEKLESCRKLKTSYEPNLSELSNTMLSQ